VQQGPCLIGRGIVPEFFDDRSHGNPTQVGELCPDRVEGLELDRAPESAGQPARPALTGRLPERAGLVLDLALGEFPLPAPERAVMSLGGLRRERESRVRPWVKTDNSSRSSPWLRSMPPPNSAVPFASSLGSSLSTRPAGTFARASASKKSTGFSPAISAPLPCETRPSRYHSIAAARRISFANASGFSAIEARTSSGNPIVMVVSAWPTLMIVFSLSGSRLTSCPY
jgi:hypothetical protein